ncbi:MAG: GTP-binding protein, partial [Crenarchaeota archaeon]|nr:GTP-binding protein [Thermoproteota archaeon]
MEKGTGTTSVKPSEGVSISSKKEKRNSDKLTIALAGNANVGKSVIFNQLTGLNQITGNWPGKTVERAEGTLHFKGYNIHVIDLPGTYSLSAYSMEEIVSRDYLAIEKPDIIINVVDASALERNLYLTLQLLELEVPLVIALNQMDFAAKKGLKIDVEKLSNVLDVKIVPTVAVTGTGITELLSAVISEAINKKEKQSTKLSYGKEIEEKIKIIQNMIVEKLPKLCSVYPSRWIAIKLFEQDSDIISKIETHLEGKEIVKNVKALTI